MPGPGTLLDRPVYPLSHRPTAASGAFTISALDWDYAIGGQPFLSAAGKNGRTLARGFAAIRKDQFDNSAEPGEQALSDWWYRSQSSWHGGAGITYLEPAQDSGLRFRFASSVGIDVWTPGQLSLLKDVATLKATANSVLVRGVIDGGVDKVLHADGTVLRKLTDGGETTITWGGSGTIRALVDDGTNYFAADTVSIFRGEIDGTPNGSALWTISSAAIALGWVKQRLVLGLGPSIYELVGGSPPALPTAKFTHPNASWTWSSIAEGPSAIYAAGSAGSTSAIYEFILATDGAAPSLTVGSPALLPEGEIVHSMFGYLGRLAIGTNKGIRIATTDNGLDIGPLLFEATQPVKAFTGKGQFLFAGYTAGIDGSSGLLRIDLGTQNADGRFAYATDLRSSASGVVNSICLYGASGRVVFGVNGTGVLVEHATQLTASGYLKTGRIRFNTLEPKLFRFISLRGGDAGISGALVLSLLDQGGGESSIVSYNAAFPPGGEVALNLIQGIREYIAFKITFTRDAVPTAGPSVIGWQAKALPWTKRVKVLQVPLLCYDRERDKHSVEHGYEGRALERLTALEELITSGDSVLFQDLTSGDAFVAIVESYEMDQVKPPAGASGWGGIVTLQIRSVS